LLDRAFAGDGTQDKFIMPDNSTRQPEDASAAKIQQSIEAIDLSNSLAAPIRQAIDDVLQIAQETVGSADASVLVRDGREGGLKFLVAVSELEEALLKIRIPPGKGIAGLVFSSGQPMAVNDVSDEGSFWSGADEAVGFKTVTLLATPLRSGNETIGVLEFVNREGEPPYPPFTPEEMDAAARFADTIAKLVDSYELALLVEAAFTRSIRTTSEESGSDAAAWIDSLDAAPEHRDLLLLAMRLREIVSRGDAEREMLRDVLQTLARFAERRSAGSSYFNF
jgi:GAF domain-containing protein